MRQCGLRHQLLYFERWTKEPTSERDARSFGTIWHQVLAAHYLVIKGHQDQALLDTGDWRKFDHELVADQAFESANAVMHLIQDDEVRDLIGWMYRGHRAEHGLDLKWRILAVEFECEVELPAPAGVDVEIKLRMKMKIDLVVKEAGRLLIVDHKSCKDLPKKMELDLDDQFGLYIWGMRQLGYKVFGAVHNAARKKRLVADQNGSKPTPLSDRFLRSPLVRSAKELNRIAIEAWQQAFMSYRGLYDVIELRRSGVDVDAPRSPSPRDCAWRCDFTEACIAGRKGVSVRDYIYRLGYRQDRSRH